LMRQSPFNETRMLESETNGVRIGKRLI